MGPHLTEPLFPGNQLLHVLNVAKRWSVEPDTILEGSPLTVEQLQDTAMSVPLSLARHVVARARTLTGEPALGVYLGLSIRAAHHGYLGFATMSAPTVRAAIELAVRFVSTVTPAFRLSLRERGKHAHLEVEELVDLGDVRDVALLATLIGLRSVGSAMTGHESTATIELAMERPAYASRVEQAVARIAFGRPRNRLSFDAESLDMEHLQHDPVTLRMFVEQCERIMDSTALVTQLGGRIRALLRGQADVMPSIDDIAHRIGVSSRTLKRKLAGEGLSFRTLVSEEREKRAITLLRSDLPLAHIASRLGYSNTANFERAFRRWTRQTPTAFRRSRGSTER